MQRGDGSSKHHWWPVALQSYWADRHGDVSWIQPSGKVTKKQYRNRNIGIKRNGHTLLRGKGVWETNFEHQFDIDDKIHGIIDALKGLVPSNDMAAKALSLLLKKDRPFHDLCGFHHLDEQLHRDLLLLMHSLLIRSPGWRSKYERFPMSFGLPRSEDVGKGNMHGHYRAAKNLCQRGYISLQHFVLLHSPRKKFICGDGYLDWLTAGLMAQRISGRALVPLTPHLCVYFCTLGSQRQSAPNCTSLYALPWMVDWANDLTQIYSGERLFFLGKAPKLTQHFLGGQHLEHSDHRDELIDQLDELAGNGDRAGFGFGW